TLLGRLIGSVATGGLVGVVAWLIFGSLILSGIAGVIALVFTMLSDGITAGTPRGRGGWSGGCTGASWGGSSGGSSSSDSGGFSGGGGSFGSGGASGSWEVWGSGVLAGISSGTPGKGGGDFSPR